MENVGSRQFVRLPKRIYGVSGTRLLKERVQIDQIKLRREERNLYYFSVAAIPSKIAKILSHRTSPVAMNRWLLHTKNIQLLRKVITSFLSNGYVQRKMFF